MSELQPQDRARILKESGLCFSETCTAHDAIVKAILRLEHEAYWRGVSDGQKPK